MNAHSARAAPAEILYRWLRASPPLALMLAITLLVAASQQTLIEWLKRSTPRITNVAGALLIIVGLFNAYPALDRVRFRQLRFL